MHSFHHTLDLNAINAWILYKELTKENISRRDFTRKLAQELAEPSVQNQNNIPAQRSLTESDRHQKKFCQAKVSSMKNRLVGVCTKSNKTVCGTCTRQH